MERIVSFREADMIFASLASDNDGFQGEHPAAYLLVGGRGYGKTELLNRLSRRFEAANYRVSRVRSYGMNGGLKFHVFNEIINQIDGEIEERPLGKIVEFFQKHPFDNGEKTCIVIDAIEKMEMDSRNLFLFLSRMASRRNFFLIGAFTGQGEDQDEEAFLDVAVSEDNLEIIRLKKPSYDDLKYYMEDGGYLLPDHFTKELYRLVNGNFQLLEYCFRYYEENGIINRSKQLEEVSYRFFPIPPSLEAHFSRLLLKLPLRQKRILEVIALIGEELEPSFISELTGYKRGEILGDLEDLAEKGFVTENNLNFGITNSIIADLIVRSISRDSIVLNEAFTNSKAFNDLSVLTRLRVYTKLRDRKSIEKLVDESWEELYDNNANLSVTSSFFSDLLKFVESKDAKEKIMILLATLLINEGQQDLAMKILNDPDLTRDYPDLVSYLMAKSLERLNRFNDSNSILETLIKNERLNPKIRGNALILQNLNYNNLGNLDEQLRVCKEAKSLAEKFGLEDIVADALNGIANVMIRKYDLDQAEALFKQTLEINRNLKKWDRILLTNNNLAIIMSYKGMMEESAELLKEVIEGSYITGDIMSRAYASYNISEIYFNAGKFEEAKRYIPYALKLVEKLNDTNLSFPFYRFLVTLNLTLFNIESAIRFSKNLISVANIVGDERMSKHALGMSTLVRVLNGDEPEEKLDPFFDIELRVGDDYTPIWYSIGVMHFSLRRNLEKAKECLKKSREAAENIGDYYGRLIARVSEVYIHMARGDTGKILQFINETKKAGQKLLIFEGQLDLIEQIYGGSSSGKYAKEPASVMDLIALTEHGYLTHPKKGESVYSVFRKRFYEAAASKANSRK
ncbi:MAG: hypothetical protein QW812_02125 [Thermoplasmataceae archaeon]